MLGGHAFAFGLFGSDALGFQTGRFFFRRSLRCRFRSQAFAFGLFGGHALGVQARRFFFRRSLRSGFRSQAFGFGLFGGHALGVQARRFFFRRSLRSGFRSQAFGFGLFGGHALGLQARRFGGLVGCIGRVHHEREACLRQGIPQRGDARRQAGIHRHSIRCCLQCVGRRTDRLGHLPECRNADAIGRCARGEQPLHVGFRRRRECRDGGHLGHRERAVQRMDRAQQAIVDRRVAIARSGEPRIDGFQVTADLGTEDLQQDRIHPNRGGIAGCIARQRCFELGRWHRRFASGRDIQQDFLASAEAICHALHRGKVHRQARLPAQGRM